MKEIELGIAADIGALQFLPKVVGNQSLLAELLYTGRKFDANEAKELGLVSRILPDRETAVKEAIKLATEIASKSPIAVQGIKHNLQYSLEHTIDDSLKYMAVWNMSNLQSEDTMKAAMAVLTKAPSPTFDDL